ncbi:MAG: HAD family hydrolase [Actinomycetota bacterium]|nr:HAD family hydrolase [Actinomycetota bacterium]
MTSAVLLDFYGTLARAVTWGTPFEDVFARRGFQLDRDLWARAGEEAVFDGQEHVEHSSTREQYVAWEIERLRRRVTACGVGAADVEPLVAELYAESKTFTLEAYEEVPEVLDDLRRRQVLVAVCSNWDWDLDRALAQTGLTDLVDVVVTSAQAGARKPHPRIYRHTLDLCRVSPADAVFVGDTWGPDVEGPLAAGLRPVHVCRNGASDVATEPPPPLIDGVRRFPDLRGVIEVVSS